MRNSLLALCLIAAVGFSACDNKSSSTPSTGSTDAPKTQLAVANTICPVQDIPAITDDPAFTVDYHGQKIAFCCMKCPPKFNKEPERYMEKMRKDPAKYGYKAP